MKKPPRFFINLESIDIAEGVVTLSQRALIAQIKNVLRLRAGDFIDVLDGHGRIYHCRLDHMSANKKQATQIWSARIESAASASGEPPILIEIALPILRSNRYEWALEKLTELGASSVVPIVVEHSVTREGKLERWQAIVREAAEQCERALVPRVLPPIALQDYLKELPAAGQKQVNLICAERSNAQALPVVLCNQMHEAPHKISVIVGAEGGFTEEEIQLAENAGAKPVSLGSRILRSETAAIYALSLIISQVDQNSLAAGTI
jgi:16S rRNA (uracil1498-N3)-methyltransferase